MTRALRAVTLVLAATFAIAAAQNFGLRVAIGPLDVFFEEPIWQAGVGEIVIAAVLMLAAVRATSRSLWIAYALAALGIAFGLSSVRVIGAARAIHVVLVPLELVGVALLIARRRG